MSKVQQWRIQTLPHADLSIGGAGDTLILPELSRRVPDVTNRESEGDPTSVLW